LDRAASFWRGSPLSAGMGWRRQTADCADLVIVPT
jgi:hypothetical protein